MVHSSSNREFKLRVIRQTANARQRKILRYQVIKSKWTCCFKTEIHNYSFDARNKIWNENVQRKFCQENSNLPFAVTGNVKLKLPYRYESRMPMIVLYIVYIYIARMCIETLTYEIRIYKQSTLIHGRVYQNVLM
jgi:hypothetical protein